MPAGNKETFDMPGCGYCESRCRYESMLKTGRQSAGLFFGRTVRADRGSGAGPVCAAAGAARAGLPYLERERRGSSQTAGRRHSLMTATPPRIFSRNAVSLPLFLCSCLRAEEFQFQHGAQTVIDGQVILLDPVHFARRHAYRQCICFSFSSISLTIEVQMT